MKEFDAVTLKHVNKEEIRQNEKKLNDNSKYRLLKSLSGVYWWEELTIWDQFIDESVGSWMDGWLVKLV